MRVYQKIIPLRWGDLDAMNHLNNTLYFRLMEEARISWFVEHDLMMDPGGDGPILAHASCDFLKPMTYPSNARVTHIVTRLGRSSMDVDVTIEDDRDEPTLYAKGRNVLVWMNYQAGRTAPWPERVRSALADVASS
jgi:acyl-CoA thioester hydrolase